MRCTQIYRRAREFFDQPSIKFIAGISFAKSNERTGKSLEPEPNVEEANGVQAREIALEDYLLSRVKNFFTDRKKQEQNKRYLIGNETSALIN